MPRHRRLRPNPRRALARARAGDRAGQVPSQRRGVTMDTATVASANIPPLIRAAQLVVSGESYLHVDNMTGCIVHDTKVERALLKMGVDLFVLENGERPDEPILIKRKKGGPKINPIMLDLVTAGMLVAVWNKL